MAHRFLQVAKRGIAAATGAAALAMTPAVSGQAPQSWWAPLAQETASVGWADIDASGFGPDETLARLALRRTATIGARGYWMTHLRAIYSAPQDLPGVDGEAVHTSEVYVAMLLDCERGSWLLAGAYGATDADRATLLAPLAHAGLEATDVALDRVTRLACRAALAARNETAPAGAALVELPRP